MIEIILLLSFFLYSVFSISLTLNVGKMEKEEKDKQSFGFKFMIIYGTFIIIAFPLFSIFSLNFLFTFFKRN